VRGGLVGLAGGLRRRRRVGEPGPAAPVSVNPFLPSALASAGPRSLPSTLARNVTSPVNCRGRSPEPGGRGVLLRPRPVPGRAERAIRGFVLGLDDGRCSVVFAAPTVVREPCTLNPKGLVPFIPELCETLRTGGNEAILLRLTEIMPFLCAAEPRLQVRTVRPQFSRAAH